MLVIGVVSGILSTITYAAYGGGASTIPQFFAVIVGAVMHAVIVGAGVGVSLAFVRPIAVGSPLRTIVFRGVIAAAIGAGAFLVLDALYSLLVSLSTSGPFFGYAFPDVATHNTLGASTLAAVIGGLQDFVTEVPLVLLVILVIARLWSEVRSVRP